MQTEVNSYPVIQNTGIAKKKIEQIFFLLPVGKSGCIISKCKGSSMKICKISVKRNTLHTYIHTSFIINFSEDEDNLGQPMLTDTI